MPRSDGVIAAACGIAAVALYVLSGVGHPTVYDYQARLAEALAQGRWWLTEAPPHLNELLPCGEGRWCVAYPPLPALVALPFVAVLASDVAQSLASAVTGGLAAAPMYLALRRLDAPKTVALLTTAFGAAGTTLWFSASDGRAWFFAHSVAVLCSSLALLAALDGRRSWLVGALIGAAALARLPVGFAALGLALLVARRSGRRLTSVVVGGALGILPFALFELGYNLLRWGLPFEEGYARLVFGDPLFTHGRFSLAYLPRHLYAILMQAPEFVDGTLLFARANWIGVSLVLTSPALVFAVAALAHVRVRYEVVPLALAAALPFFNDMLHANVGFAQFGYRYSLDAQPFLLMLVALGASWREGRWMQSRRTFLGLVVWSVLANAYGVVTISFLGYVH